MFSNCKVVIARFILAIKVTENDIANIVASKQLNNIPIISGVDFGHTLPMLTLPIGGKVKISASDAANITIVN